MAMKEEPPKFAHIESCKAPVIINFFCFFLLGLPLWWITTAIYRAPLPFDSISAQHVLKVIHPNTKIFDFHDFKSKVLTIPIDFYVDSGLEQVSIAGLIDELDQCTSSSLATINDNLDFSTGNSLALKYKLNFYAGRKDTENGRYQINLIKSPNEYLTLRNRDIIIGTNSKITTNNVSDALCTIISALLSHEAADISHFSRPHEKDTTDDFMKAVKYSPKYRVSMSLLNGNSKYNYIRADMRQVGEYMKPFFAKLCDFSEFIVNSKFNEFSELRVTPVEEDGGFHVYPEMFPQLVNTAGWGLSSALSNETELNLIAYIVNQEYQPLSIINKEGKVSNTNGITIPQSGGLVVLNVRDSNISDEVWKSKVVPVWIQQLRELLKIKSILPNVLETTIASALKTKYKLKLEIEKSPFGVSDLELDSLLRQRTVETVQNAIDTLESLDRMLKKLKNMAVGDHIKEQVLDALRLLHIATQDQEQPISLLKMFMAAKMALERAESAFFDPSMTALLYFPDEHLLAVYLPFLFPVAVPFIASSIKHLKTRTSIKLVK